ncbi:hypothetical protein B0H14DRAFT_2907129, partial [Mycena olivaceomarginata]
LWCRPAAKQSLPNFDINRLCSHLSTTAVFCFSRDLENSSLSLEWVLTSGVPATNSMVSGVLSLPCTNEELETVCCLQIKRSAFCIPRCSLRTTCLGGTWNPGASAFAPGVTSSLPFDLVLGRDWLQFIRDSLPNACFHLTSGPLDLRTRRGHRPKILRIFSYRSQVTGAIYEYFKQVTKSPENGPKNRISASAPPACHQAAPQRFHAG